MTASLANVFWRALRRDGDPPDAAALEARLSHAWERGARAWPGVALSAEDFVSHWGSVLPPEGSPALCLDDLWAEDFYLAAACAQAQAGALALFDAHFLSAVPRYLSPFGHGAAFAAEVTQLLREKLFVALPGAPPKIAAYNGLSAMGAWLRVVAVRAALSELRKARSKARDAEASLWDGATRAVLTSPDPELHYIKTRYANEFRASFQATLEALDPEQKALLRLHYKDGVTVEELGVLFRVHRSTVARWIARYRGEILAQTRRRLRENGALTESEVASILRLVQSELEHGASALFAADEEARGG
jgi:RNA polymerase sigma-70 factor (ECF subfamily)